MFYGIDPLELQDLGEKLLILSHQMPTDTGPHGPGDGTAATSAFPWAPAVPLPAPDAFARALYQMRQKRLLHLDDCGLGEPSWDMLLDLYIARHDCKTVRTTSLCVAAATPTTTGLRYIAMLERRGLVRRMADPADHRATNVALSDKGFEMLDGFLRAMLERFTATLFGLPSAPRLDNA